MNSPNETLVASLFAHAKSAPEHRALSSDSQSVTYGALARSILAVADRLRSAGVRHGDRVVLSGPNSHYFAMAYFAIHSVGAIAVCVDADTPPDSARWIASDCEARLALTAKPLDLPILTENLREFCETANGHFTASIDCDLDDFADILYTTGTSGRKKGVLLKHRHIAQAALNINRFIGTCRTDVELVPIPLSHSFGLGRLRCMAQAGHTLALENGMRNPAKTLKTLLDSKATGLAMVPAGFDLLLRMTKDRLADASRRLRYVEIGSAPMPMETKLKLMSLLPTTRICHHYGLTEASRSTFIEYHEDRDKLDSVGRASPNVVIAVRDDSGHDVGPGIPGEIAVRGGMVMHGYWGQPDLTNQVLEGGWLRTGDWGYLDPEGYLFLLARQSDLINVGGLKVAPEEIERLLDTHPAVAESACVGVPDPNGITGQCVKAAIVTRSAVSDTELVDWLRGRLEEFKIPRLWLRVDRITKTASGKIQRHLL